MYPGTVTWDKARLYGLPHIHARYTADRITATEPDDDWVPCAFCGQSASNIHHEPPRSVSSGGSLLRCTKYGKFVLKPALIALCGTGTMGCHGMRHNGLLRIDWRFYDPADEERWESGWLLSHGFPAHSELLYKLGYWELTDGERTVGYTGGMA